MGLRRWSTIAAAAAAVLVMAGCGGTTTTTTASESPAANTSGTAETTTAPADSATTAPPPPTPSTDVSSGVATGASSGLCTAAMLSGVVQEKMGGAAAGSTYGELVLTNKSSAACVIEGFPGVSYVGANGKQIGAPADRDPQTGPVAVNLKPGTSAVAVLRQIDARNFGAACDAQAVAGIRVYPPSATDWLVAAHEGTACGNPALITMTIGSFQAS